MQTFLPVDSSCIGCPTTSSSICNLFARLCFSKKYQTGKNSLDQNSSTKHPHDAIRSTQHLNPVSRATSKWPIKIWGTWLVIKQFYCFLLITMLHASFADNWIIFPRFCTLFTYGLLFFRKFIEIDRFALRAAIYLGFVSNLLSLLSPPPPPWHKPYML